jgi:hypothetical protein
MSDAIGLEHIPKSEKVRTISICTITYNHHILIQPGSKDFRSLVWTSWVYLTVLQKVSKFLIKFTLWALQAFLGQCAIFTTLYIDKTANKQMKTNCDKSPQIMRKTNAESDPQAASGGHMLFQN